MPRADGRRDPGPCEHRIDGDRITELVPAEEWLAMKNKNALEFDPDKIMPPFLPRHNERDHLKDNLRVNSKFDAANPGVTQYVRVTRRINTDRAAEDYLQQQRRAARLASLEAEKRDQQEKMEILELRSMGIRAILKKRADQDAQAADTGR